MSRKKRGLYFIEQILDYKQYNGQKYYLVKWQGYNNRDCTWEKPEKIPNLAQFLHQFEENVKKNGSNFYHIENDEPPQLEDFIGVPSLSKQNWHQHQQEQINLLQNQVDQLKSEIDLMKKYNDEIVQLITASQQNEKSLQPNQQQDSEIMQESTSEQSRKTLKSNYNVKADLSLEINQIRLVKLCKSRIKEIKCIIYCGKRDPMVLFQKIDGSIANI